MRISRIVLSLGLCLALTALAAAQPLCLTTTFAHNNGQSGNMFDVEALSVGSGVTIVDFDINVDPGTFTVNVYTHPGTFVGTEQTPGAWGAPIASVSVTSNATSTASPGVPTPLVSNIAVPIAPGAVQAFYVTLATATSINYTNGAGPIGFQAGGIPFAGDNNINFWQGTGNAANFGAVFMPRVFNGNICYNIGIPPVGFQTNSGSAALTIDNTTGNAFFATVVTKSLGGGSASGTLEVTSGDLSGGQPFELVMSNAGIVPLGLGGTALPSGIVNLNLISTLSFLHGGSVVSLASLPGAGFPGGVAASQLTVPWSTAATSTMTVQALVVSPGSPSGLLLTQATELDIVP